MTRLLCALLLLAAALPGLAGDSIFLVARKDMADPNFHEAVVLVTRVEGGAPLGVVVNRPTAIPLAGFFPEIDAIKHGEDKIHFGGPVARTLPLVLFKGGDRPEDALEVLPGVYLASSRKLIHEILAGDRAVEQLRVFVGYAGWAPDQLEREIARGDWRVLRADEATLFEKDAARLWPELDRRASRTRVRAIPP